MTKLTRRSFVGQMGAAAVAVPTVVSQAQDRDPFSVERFSPLVGETFRVSVDGKTWRRCVLEEAVETGPAPRSDFRRPVSLMFRSVGGDPLPSGNYVVMHRALGRLKLHLNPVGRDQRSQVVFN